MIQFIVARLVVLLMLGLFYTMIQSGPAAPMGLPFLVAGVLACIPLLGSILGLTGFLGSLLYVWALDLTLTTPGGLLLGLVLTNGALAVLDPPRR